MNITDVKKVYTEMFNEETRLCRSNSSSIEYLTNKKYINIKRSFRLLMMRVGATTRSILR